PAYKPSQLTRHFLISFNAPQPTEIYTLSLHDALPICEFGAEETVEIDFHIAAGAEVFGRRPFDAHTEPGLVGGHIELVVIADERSEEHTSELQSLRHLVCRLLLEKKKQELLVLHHNGI